MSIKGQLQKREINKFGFLRVKVAGEWFGADKKGDAPVAEGDIVEFDPYTNDRGYASFKSQSLKKVSSAPAGKPVNQGPVASKDEYWAEKEARDLAKEPKIAYFAAFERATGFVALAHSVGALKSLAGAKDTAKLDILTALVDEQTQRILNASYEQLAPEFEDDSQAEGETSESSTDGNDTEDQSKWK